MSTVNRVQIIEGRAEIIISGNPFVPDKGESIIMPAGQPHALKVPERFKMLLTMNLMICVCV